jgi:hypothetical protein
MYSLELLWPVFDDFNESAVIVKSVDLMALKVIADDADFRIWARLNGAAFVEIWDGCDNLHYFRGFGRNYVTCAVFDVYSV